LSTEEHTERLGPEPPAGMAMAWLTATSIAIATKEFLNETILI